MIKDPEFMKDRPAWWAAWTDYPHGSLSEEQAREISRYCVKLEERLIQQEQSLRNIFMLANRERPRRHTPKISGWLHVLRFCKEAGFEPTILQEEIK